ncbi:secretory phospholipase A2 receptor-like, partial [Silurus asotus]
FINQAVSWPDAQKYCRTKYTDLVRVKDPSVLVELNKMAASKGLTLWPLWIGLYNDFYNWRWSFNNVSQTSTNLTLWFPGEPDNYAGHESCGGVYVAGNWADWDCALQKPFICYNGVVPITFSAQRTTHLFFINQVVSWPNAQKYCRTKYTDLARVKDPSVLVELNKMAASKGLTLWPLWIGLYNDFYNWRWSFNNVSQTSTNLTLWFPGEPDNYAGHESCGGILAAGNWADWDCALQRPFICYNGVVPITFSVLQTKPGQYLINQKLSWPDPQKYCRTKYSDLARVKDSSVLAKLTKMAVDSGLTSWRIWIGLYNDLDSWRWSFNNLSLSSTNLTNWYSGQPDNYMGHEACGGIYGAGYWADWDCAGQRSFICYEAGNSGADRFIGVTNPQLSWSEAQTYCRTHYTDLASALTQADNDLLAQIVYVQRYSWFGLYRDTWKWLNETVASNLQWNPGQPNNANPQENCGVLQDKMMGDENCNSLNHFFCEISVVPITFSVLQTKPGQYLISRAVSWPNAQKYCRMKYTDLARVKDSSVLLELIKIAVSNGLKSWRIWIGLYNDFDSWRWSFNNLSLSSTNLTNWYSGQPYNNMGHEACGGIYGVGYWADWDCAGKKYFICYDAGNSGAARFIGVTNPQLSWSEAQTYCRTNYTDLASALTQADNDVLAQIVSVQGYSWFGLYRETWKWLNGTVASNLQWKPGNPDNAKPQENCGMLQDKMMGDQNCNSLNHFFCEFSVVPITYTVQQPALLLYYIEQAVSWPNAQKYCRTKYSDLARVKTTSVLTKLTKMAASGGVTEWPLWIGLYNDFNSWRWSFNNLSLNSTNLTNWYSGQPDNSKGREACGGIYGAGYWADWNCALQKPFICYNAGNSGANRFIGVTNPRVNWSEAQTYCRTHYTDLASALTQADNDLLTQIVSVQGISWFGLYRDTWKWLNGTVASNLQWNPGNPDNAKPQENCGMLQNGLIGDENCKSLHYFFC